MRTRLFPALVAGLVVSISAQAKINNFAQVAPGIYRGSQPDQSSDFEVLRSLGIKTVLNLRNTKKNIETDRKLTEAAGLSYVNIPMDAVWGPSSEQLDAALSVMTDRAAQPVFVHCQLGQDRTGIVVGLYRVFVEHWTPARAYKEMQSFGYDFLLIGLDHSFWHRLEQAGYQKPEIQ